ncbi:DUF881 domain-containing protein [Rarobacter faecitabidus]|nr:DUF881 domain-containing protein [Rarobacter faecitabidus]
MDEIAPGESRSRSASMNLLLEVMDHPLDPGYVEAKKRRSHRRTSPLGVVTWTLIAVLAGISIAAAVVYLRIPRTASVQARALLAEQITAKRDEVEGLAQRNEELHSEIARLSNDVLYGPRSPSTEASAASLLAMASTPVSGPGVSVALNDGPEAAQLDAARVQDLDIQLVVNTLWSAGAEAIAINGVRLGPTSAIRGAGGAVLVDFVGLTPPYEISAIGQSNALQVELARSSTADHLSRLNATYGITFKASGESTLDLPAVGVPTLRYSKAVSK